jgi:hypothetical protein
MTLQIWDPKGQLGTVTLADGKMTSPEPVLQRLADKYQDQYGDQAFYRLAQLDNGYIQARLG